jgi:hypothetical protein
LCNRHVPAGIKLNSQLLARTVAHALFNVLPCNAAGDTADNGGHLLAGSAADFATKQAADQGTGTGPHGSTVIALDRDIRCVSYRSHFDAISALSMALL